MASVIITTATHNRKNKCDYMAEWVAQTEWPVLCGCASVPEVFCLLGVVVRLT